MGCFCCRESRKVLDSYHIKKDCIKILEINNRDDMAQIQDYMQTSTGSKSVPRVFIGGDFIGGNVDIKTMHGNGKLMLLLRRQGFSRRTQTVHSPITKLILLF